MILKRGQVWIETVLYTLIGLALIGLVLAFAMPKIDEAKDKAVVDQAIISLNSLDEKISAVSGVAGNKRFVGFTLKRGELVFDTAGNKVILTIDDLRKPYSEPDIPIQSGRIEILSTEGQKESSVSLTIGYGSIDLLYDEKNDEKTFTQSSTPYEFSVESLGSGKINILESSE